MIFSGSLSTNVNKLLKNQKAWERGYLKHNMGGPSHRRRCLRRECSGRAVVCRKLPFPNGKPMPF